MKILCFSDIHGSDVMQEEYKHLLPEDTDIEMILIAGDILPLDIQFNPLEAEKWLVESFIPMCRKLMLKCGAKRVIFIAGNHDKAFETLDVNEILCCDDIIYLNETSYSYYFDGHVWSIYGIPYLSMKRKWGFVVSDDQKLEKKYNAIPGCDILLTHNPPYGTPLSQELRENKGRYELIDPGNRALRKRIENRWAVLDDIGYVICGHIHEGDHRPMYYSNTLIANVAYKDDEYIPAYKMLVLDCKPTEIEKVD